MELTFNELVGAIGLIASIPIMPFSEQVPVDSHTSVTVLVTGSTALEYCVESKRAQKLQMGKTSLVSVIAALERQH